MTILTKVEAKGWRGRLFLTGVTLTVIIGSITMLYPFMIMTSGAMRSDMDDDDMGVVPRFLVDDNELVQKFLETKYNWDVSSMNRLRQTRDYDFRHALVPEEVSETAVSDLETFMTEYDHPNHWQMLGGTEIENQIACVNQRRLVSLVHDRFDGDLDAFNAQLGAPFPSWWMVNVPMPRWGEFRTVKEQSALWDAYFDLMWASEPAERIFVNISGLFLDRLAYPRYGRSVVDDFRDQHNLDIESYSEFSLPRRVPPPEQKTLREEWLEFIFEDHLNLSFARSDATDADYQDFLEDRYGGSIDELNLYFGSDYESFKEVKLPDDHAWVEDGRRDAYKSFLRSQEHESLRLVGPEFAWRDFLKDSYGDVESAALAHNADYERWEDCVIPLAQMEKQYVLNDSGTFRRRYAGRNFRIVVTRMFLQGRPFLNTIIYVSLALLFALTVMPLSAYALSRFQPPGMWKIIFIFVATMAFPPMVDMIPRFLLIRELGLLNTYIALVFPLMVNGMLIFLLMGFFDSIPQDLYDAAVIDGASELRIFWQITMAMSKPILAVVALQTFNRAWRTFLYPLIVCPDERMHVLAVWLQQFQLEAPQTAMYAAIIVASVPSLLIFMFAQRTIMRGIAVPSEK